MADDITVEQALVQGLSALQVIVGASGDSGLAGMAMGAAILTGEVIDIITNSAAAEEEVAN